MFCANYARIEGCYYQIDNLMACSVRRVLNLTYTWLFDLIGGTEQWDKDFRRIFEDTDEHEDFDYVDLPSFGEPERPPELGPAPEPERKPAARLLSGI